MQEKSEFLKKGFAWIEEEYQKRVKEFPEVFEKIEKNLELCHPSVQIAMKYLYANMPYSDIGNYSFETFFDYAEHSVWLWEKSKRVQALPEEIYLNYILFHRVNEEEIAPCRKLFFENMENRECLLEEKSEKKAAIEVNYWCSQEAAYHVADERTLAARTVYLTGHGRCGEESVFAVNALRSVGIPARQVYAPRWSHCDDNHAWVEIYEDGEWYFMGACEAEPILNKGWFTNASSRAMMIHSRWFESRRPSNEEIVGKEGMVTTLNQLSRYANTTEIEVLVSDSLGQPISNIMVQFEILNYSEYVPIVRLETDEEGRTHLKTGLGSLCICVYQEEKVVRQWIDTRNKKFCHLILEELQETKKWQIYDFIAPKDAPIHSDIPTKEQKKEGDRRLLAAAKQCRRKRESWENPEFREFEEQHTDEVSQELISCLTKKDKDDCKKDVLEEHLCLAIPYEREYPRGIFVKSLLNPRISSEIMTSYRKGILEFLTEEQMKEFRTNPKMIWEKFVKEIPTNFNKERSSIFTTPLAILRLKTASYDSKKILFVAIARSIGIPARLNPEDKAMEYWHDGKYRAVLEENKKECILTLKKLSGTNWQYTHNWTVAKFEQDGLVTLNLEEKMWQDEKLEMEIEEGLYQIVTSNRLPNGNILEAEYTVRLSKGEHKEVTLLERKANLQDMLESIEIRDFELKTQFGDSILASKITQDKSQVLFWLEEGKEPTEHILNELLENKEKFLKYAEQLNFVIRTSEAVCQPTLAKTLAEIPNIRIYYDDFKENLSVLGRRMYVDFEKLPLIIVTKGKLNGIYAVTGYNVGTADLILKILSQ